MALTDDRLIETLTLTDARLLETLILVCAD